MTSASSADLPLKTRSAIITGASSGIGLAIAEAFVEAGASVLICARDHSRLEEASTRLKQLARPGQSIEARTADVANPADAEALVNDSIELFGGTPTALVNNAGVQGPTGPLETLDWDEWTRTVEVNLYGPTLLARALIPAFKREGYGKIIQLSGGGATAPRPMFSAYGASKAAVVRLAETLAEELRPHGVDVNAIAPGAINTRMLAEVLAAGDATPEFTRAIEQERSGGNSPQHAARLAVWLASSDSDGISGKLLSAIWDPWQTLAKHREDLDADIYTLRRITPRDRDMDWGEE